MLILTISSSLLILALDASLTAANQTLTEAETQWQGIVEERDVLIQQALDLNRLATSKYISYIS